MRNLKETILGINHIAEALLCSSSKILFVSKRIDPFTYIERLSEYGLKTKIKPVLRREKLSGYYIIKL